MSRGQAWYLLQREGAGACGSSPSSRRRRFTDRVEVWLLPCAGPWRLAFGRCHVALHNGLDQEGYFFTSFFFLWYSLFFTGLKYFTISVSHSAFHSHLVLNIHSPSSMKRHESIENNVLVFHSRIPVPSLEKIHDALPQVYSFKNSTAAWWNSALLLLLVNSQYSTYREMLVFKTSAQRCRTVTG